MATVRLNTGIIMPIIGVGTYKIRGQDIFHVLDTALKVGYRSIDSAAVYRNEKDIQMALQTLLPKHKLKREDVFLTSKLAPADHGVGKCREAVLTSLANLDVDYMDLYLIHWPGTQGRRVDDAGNPHRRLESWRILEQLHRESKVRNIGVSNYTFKQMEELLEVCDVKPAVLQSEYHPHLVQENLVKLCHENDIHFQAYSSLGSPAGKNELLREEKVIDIAEKHGKSQAQVLLRWAVQQNIGVLPMSTNPSHIEDNLKIFDFELSDTDMELLSGLNQEKHYCWDSSLVL